MAHMIEKNDTLFAVGASPWHRLGTTIQEAPSIEEAIRLAGLDWQVGLEELVLKNGSPVKIDHRASVRVDTGDILGVVGSTWKPLQNIDAFKWFNPFIESKEVTFETAGSLKNNRIVWILGKIHGMEGEAVKGDPIERYVLLTHSHDGMMAIRTGFTDIRVVCNNTLNMAFNSQASKLIRIRHSGRAMENLENVRVVMDVVNQEFHANLEQLKKLTNKDINHEDIKKYVKATFFQGVDLDSTRASNRFSSTLDRINDLIETGRGADLKGVRGTVYGLYNASTEYITHEAGKGDETRLSSLWFGGNAKLNELLLSEALAMVG